VQISSARKEVDELVASLVDNGPSLENPEKILSIPAPVFDTPKKSLALSATDILIFELAPNVLWASLIKNISLFDV
jgi:hypothetical protein